MKRCASSALIYAIIVTLFISPAIYPCTTFVRHHGNRLVLGRNLDWITGTGLIIVNPRNLEKVAITDPSEKPATWVSKFGSVTFNQVGRELPFGGINESGLVVEHMTFDKTTYPSKDHRAAIGAFQWIQFQLDNYSSVEEVINSDTIVRISDATNKIHFLVCDRSGHTAAIELLDGKMVCHTGKDLPVRVLANSSYDESLSCYNNNGDTQYNRSLYNFSTAAQGNVQADASSKDSLIENSFHTLRDVSQGLGTKWSIVYDISDMKIYIKVFETPTIAGEQKIFRRQPPYDPITKVVDFKALDFNCSGVAKVFDLNFDHDGVVNPYFVDYSTAINRDFIGRAFAFFKGWGVPISLKDEDMDNLAKYPDSFKCRVVK